MRKKIFAVALAALIALGAGAAVLGGQNELKANAANLKITEMVDNFDAENLNADAWTLSGGVEKRTEYSALRLSAINAWGQQVTLQGRPIDETWDSFYIEYDLSWLSAASGWTGMFFGNLAANGEFSAAKYLLNLNGDGDTGTPGTTETAGKGIRLGAKKIGEGGFEDKFGKSVFRSGALVAAGNRSAGGSVLKIRMDFTKVDGDGDKTHSMSLRWGVKGQALGSALNFGNLIVKGYIGFTTYNTHVAEISNFKLEAVKGTEVILPFEDDFSTGNISFPSSPSVTANWRCVGVGESKVYCGNICSIDFSEVSNGTLTYSNPLELNPLSDKSFEIVYEVSLGGISETTYIGSGFGLSGFTSKADEKNFIGFRADGAGYKLGLIKNGVLTGSEIAFAAAGLKAKLRFVGFYDKTVGVYVNSALIGSFKNIEFDGHTCVGVYTAAGLDSKSDTDIDSFELYIYESVATDGNAMSINFQGRKEYELFGSVIKEHYYNTRQWVMYGGVKFPIQENRSYIMFTDIKYDVGFAPKARFGDAITRFDFRPSSLPEDGRRIAPFGYSFGRDYLDATYLEAQGVYFQRTDAGGTRIFGRNMKTAEGGDSVTLTDKNVFENVNTWYTCLIIVSNRTAKVYLKKTEADDSAFGAPVITFTEVNSFGYVALTIDGTDGLSAYYNATNFSIIDIDPLKKGVA